MKTIAIAKGTNVRISPSKANLVAKQIRNQNVVMAIHQLENSNRKANVFFLSILKSAIANAMAKSASVDVESLMVTESRVDLGTTLKRFRPRAFGRGMTIRKKSSHIFIGVGLGN